MNGDYRRNVVAPEGTNSGTAKNDDTLPPPLGTIHTFSYKGEQITPESQNSGGYKNGDDK